MGIFIFLLGEHFYTPLLSYAFWCFCCYVRKIEENLEGWVGGRVSTRLETRLRLDVQELIKKKQPPCSDYPAASVHHPVDVLPIQSGIFSSLRHRLTYILRLICRFFKLKCNSLSSTSARRTRARSPPPSCVHTAWICLPGPASTYCTEPTGLCYIRHNRDILVQC